MSNLGYGVGEGLTFAEAAQELDDGKPVFVSRGQNRDLVCMDESGDLIIRADFYYRRD